MKPTACGGALVAIMAFVPVIARAASPTTAECVSASETAQQARHDGKLREARALFAKCVVESCPAPIRADCVEQLTAVETALPTIRFVGRSAKGENVATLTISMDGQELVDRDADNRYSVEPGDHLFAISAVGHGTISKRIVVPAGDKTREETVVFEERDVARPPSPPLLGYSVMGAGGIGLLLGTVFGFVSKSTYDDARSHCAPGSSFCDPVGVDEGRKAHSQATVATVGFVAGTALLAGGIVIVLAPWHNNTGGTRFTMSGSGVEILQSW